jgi:signal transduction histidine kinase
MVLARLDALLRRPAVLDTGLLVALGSATVVFGGANFRNPKLASVLGEMWQTRIGLWWVTAVGALLALYLRRRWPVLVCAGTAAVAAYHMWLGFAPLPADLAAPIALFAAAAHRGRRLSLALLAAALLAAAGWSEFATHRGTGGGTVAFGGLTDAQLKKIKATGTDAERAKLADPAAAGPRVPATDWGGFPVLGLVLVLAWFAGWSARTRSAYLAGLEHRAREAEMRRDQLAALAVAGERARISRELHDVVAHGLSVMVVQAQGGAAALAARPADTRQALDAIVETGRRSLADMRRLLGVVGQPGTAKVAWEPQPGLDRLPRLVQQVRQAGTAVELDLPEPPGPLPPTVDLSAYRIVQEALTNTVQHAGPGARAAVQVRYAAGAVHLDITDTGGRPPGAADGGAVGPGQGKGHSAGTEPAGEARAGRGLRGMRERATLLGGSLVAGPSTAGGFRVYAVLPLGDTT